MAEQKPERIVCSAIRKNGIIIAGVRHFDNIMRQQIRNSGGTFTHWEQGFLTNRYDYSNDLMRFVTREEAAVIALEQNQVVFEIEKVKRTGKLHSENCW